MVRSIYFTLFYLLVVSCPLIAGDFDEQRLNNWHQWRGPEASGVAPHADPPINWGPDRNIRWKVAIDGRGSSTPIVWEDRIFLLTSVDTGKANPDLPKPEDQPKRPFGIKYPNTEYEFVVVCLDRQTGREMWRRTAARKIPHEGHHGDNNFASASPTTDGQRLYAWFGMAGVFCFDLDGTPLWKRDLGEVSIRKSFAEAASPVVHDGRLIINRDNEGQSYIKVLDAETGEDLWRVERDEVSTWVTPLVVEQGGKTQVIISASNRVCSYDLANGDVIWECGGQVSNVTPSPVTDGSLAYCMSGYRGSSAVAISLEAQGDVTGTDAVAWKLDRGTPYVPSPLLYNGLLFFNQSNSAILSCVTARTGEPILERTRMEGLSRIYASPVAAAERLYYVGRSGTTLVLQANGKFEVLATNSVGEPVDASPAIVGNELFLRGNRHLFCISSAE